MSIEVTRADDIPPETWNSYVEQSPQGCIFHRYEALTVSADHADAELHPLVGYKGNEPVGLFPVFEVTKGPFSVAFSPPPNLRVSYLGPAFLNMEKLKQRKAERRRRQFIDGCFEWLDERCKPRYLHVRTTSGYDDVRPFQWNDCETAPTHTYVVDLSPGEEAVQDRFSSDARGNIRNADEDRFSIEVGGEAAIERIVRQVRERYESQDIGYGVPVSFVTELYEALDDGQVLPYVCRVDDEFVGGILALADSDRVYRWQGGVKTDRDIDVPVNDLLDWQVMADALDSDRTQYDLVGADNPRINSYKAKFGPELEVFYSIETGTRTMTLVADLYKRIK